MANLRELKKEIDYRLEEVVFDCDMAIAFQPSKEQEIFELMQKAVALRNELIAKVSNPTEPHNKSLPEVEPVIHATYILVDDQPDGLIIDMDEFDCTCTM